MRRVQVIYEYGELVHMDEVTAEHVNVRLSRGRRATVKTRDQIAMYCGVARVLIDLDYDGPQQPIHSSPVNDRG